jgi:hypothetical protein
MSEYSFLADVSRPCRDAHHHLVGLISNDLRSDDCCVRCYFRSWFFDVGLVLAMLGLTTLYLSVGSLIPIWLGTGSGIGAFSIDSVVLEAGVALVGFVLLVVGAGRVRRTKI